MFSKKISVLFVCALFLGAALAGCVGRDAAEEKPDGPSDIPSIYLEQFFLVDLPGWEGDDHAAALQTFLVSCNRMSRRDSEAVMKENGVGGYYADWQRVCMAAVEMDADADDNRVAKDFFERHFRAYLVRDAATEKDDGLFTGYYEPLLLGSLEKTERYNVPLYKRPDDLIEVNLGAFRDKLSGERIAGRVVGNRLVPYHDRAAITAGALGENGEVLVWVDDPVQAFFLHIQGSGRVRLEDGREMRVGYAGQNGHVYYAIGRHLIDIGAVAREDMSMPAIRDYLLENSDDAQDIMNKNASYIFFHELTETAGPLGAEGVPLTERRSLAVDRRVFPYGLPVWVDIDGVFDANDRIRRLMVAQDTGGAIRGAVRGDFFWGYGEEAENFAGHMKSRGRYWVLLPDFVEVPRELAWQGPRKEDGPVRMFFAKLSWPFSRTEAQ